MKEAEKTKIEKKRKVFSIFLLCAAAIILSVFAGTKFLSGHGDDTSGKKEDNNMKPDTSYIFHKQGDLVFLTRDDKEISMLDVELAEDIESHTLGLMYRTKMAENQGMLFIFQEEEERYFWMKNTVLSLDIIYLNAKREIIKIHKNAIPYQEHPSYDSDKPAMYVIEVNAGYCEKYKIKEGDKFAYTRLKPKNVN